VSYYRKTGIIQSCRQRFYW